MNFDDEILLSASSLASEVLSKDVYDQAFDEAAAQAIAKYATLREDKNAVLAEVKFTKALLRKYKASLASKVGKTKGRLNPLETEDKARLDRLSEYASNAAFAKAMYGVTYRPDLVGDKKILSVRFLKQYFGAGDRMTKAVHNVSFDITEGECFGLVGESGCGKTTTGRTVIGLYKPTSGEIYYKGYRIAGGTRYQRKQLASLKKKLADADDVQKGAILSQIEALKAEIKAIESDSKNSSPKLRNEIQMIFQDPIDSLDPRMTVEDIITEGLHIQGKYDKVENQKAVFDVLRTVGLIPEYASRYPHEFSGGQRQRIGIARAVVMNPKVLICDEPISALDVSIRAQVLNLLNELKANMGLTMLFIAHDLSVVKYFCDRIAVMYFGNMVELATSDELFKHPLHPYTKALLSAIPKPDPFYEKDRVRTVYNPRQSHDYSVNKPSFREILPGHFVLCNDAEEEAYKAEIKSLDQEKGETK